MPGIEIQQACNKSKDDFNLLRIKFPSRAPAVQVAAAPGLSAPGELPPTAGIYSRTGFVIILRSLRGRSSVVERHVANVNVEGSNPFARFQVPNCLAAAKNWS